MGSAESNPETCGWRILEVIPNGPCWDKGLCVYFDFIVGINGVRLTTSSEEFWDTIRNKQNISIILTVFNYKTRIKRDIEMTPNNEWGGDGLLGLVIVRDDFTKCDQQCIRVLSVDDKSPASNAGLQSQNDYILGTPINAFISFSIFRDTISDYIDQPLPIYVYNSKKAEVRLVEITASSQWSGDGVLGCQVGDGYLHHIPSLTEQQIDITFKPNSSYIVSSRNSKKQNQNYHSSTPTKEIQQNENINTGNTGNHVESVQNTENNGNMVKEMKNDNDDNELPTIRWTDSSHKLPIEQKEAESADIDDKQHGNQQIDDDTHHHEVQSVIKANPTQKANLLDKLEQETQKVLSQQ